MPDINDHDTLTVLNTKFDVFTHQYHQDMADIKNGYTSELADHEVRITKLETQNIKNSQTINIFRFIAGIVGGAVFYILTQVPIWVKLLLNR